MVIYGHGQHLLGVPLANHEIIEKPMDIVGIGKVIAVLVTGIFQFFANDVVAQFYALVTDINTGPGYELTYFVLRFATERTIKNLTVRAFAFLVTHAINLM
jgi:hypothetical protein